MRGKVTIILMVGLLMSFCIITTFAQTQEEQKPQPIYLLKVAVKPSMIHQYETAVKELVALYKQYKGTYPWHGFSADDFLYYFDMPVENLADLEKMFQEDEEIAKKWGEEKSKEIDKSFAGTYEYVHSSMYYYRKDLSFIPEEPRLKSEEANYRLWAFYYVQPDKDKEFQDVLKKFIALYKEKNVAEPYYIYVGGMGTEMPVYVVAFISKSAADFWTHNEKTCELIGEEGKALSQKVISLVRKRDIKTAWYRPELSYIPEKEKE